MSTPLGSDDLRAIADTIDELYKFLIDVDVYRKPFNSDTIGDVTIEILRPGDTEIVGFAVLEDGWIGFRPKQDDLRFFFPKKE